MRATSGALPFALLALAVVGCPGPPSAEVDAGADAGRADAAGAPDSGSDAAAADDGGASDVDAGGSDVDAGASDVDARAASDSGPEGSPIGAGPYVILYSSPSGPGIDRRPMVDATFEGALLTSYVAGATEAPTIGTLSGAEVGAADSIAWGRWRDGTAGGVFYTSTITLGPDQGFHYVIARPGTALATTTSFATMMGATEPTANDGSIPASMVAVTSFAATFVPGTPSRVAYEAHLTTPSGEIVLATEGGIADPSRSLAQLFPTGVISGGATATGAGCGTGCTVLNVYGVLSAAPPRIGIVYVVGQRSSDALRGAIVAAP